MTAGVKSGVARKRRSSGLLRDAMKAGNEEERTNSNYLKATITYCRQRFRRPDCDVKAAHMDTPLDKIVRHTHTADYYEAEVEHVVENLDAKDENEALARS